MTPLNSIRHMFSAPNSGVVGDYIDDAVVRSPLPAEAALKQPILFPVLLLPADHTGSDSRERLLQLRWSVIFNLSTDVSELGSCCRRS